eukprot:CAMPEP_0197868716 /NCGR_PEP_ID=MMETSP1438-20131217/45431_1 /TAXON_ID=1461541 /ORGANISM="Pterosperma sp., Strain CCMP1384" /LENGTH=240 /DNA_ID=CAMNT_0043487437 /DNA_START=616 /DNA_END=1338 /DNA_ORIENTATION=-
MYGFLLHTVDLDSYFPEVNNNLLLIFVPLGCMLGGPVLRYIVGHDFMDHIDCSLSGTYFMVASVDWMGYRWGYCDKPVLWVTKLLSSDTDFNDCKSAWCVVLSIVWVCLIPVSLRSQSRIKLPSLIFNKPRSELDELAPLMDELDKEGVPKDEQLNLARMRFALERTKLKREQIKENLKATKKSIRQIQDAKFAQQQTTQGGTFPQSAPGPTKEKKSWFGFGKSSKSKHGKSEAKEKLNP